MDCKTFFLIVAALIGLFAGTASAEPAIAESLNWSHRSELFLRGTITNGEGTVWDVVFIPGFSNVTEDAKAQWIKAGKTIAELEEKQFWLKRGENVKDGMKFARDSVTKYWYDGITNDFHHTVQQNDSIQPGEFGSVFMPLANWIFYAGDVVGRTATAPVGVAGGVLCSVACPMGHVMERPIEGGLRAVVGGTVFPGIRYVWNGFAWVGTTVTTVTSNVPTHESYFVRLKVDGQSKKSGEFVIDHQGFESILYASAKQVMTNEEKAVLDRQIKAISAELEAIEKPYRQKQHELRQQQQAITERVQNDAVKKSLDAVFSIARRSEVITLGQDARNLYVDQSQVKRLIAVYLQSQGVESLTDEMEQKIIQEVHRNLRTMGVVVETEAPDSAAVPQPMAP